MKTYRVTIAFQTLETYELQADSTEAAAKSWAYGKLISIDNDSHATIVFSVKEA